MAVTVNVYYSGINGNARRFAEEMVGLIKRNLTFVTNREEAATKKSL